MAAPAILVCLLLARASISRKLPERFHRCSRHAGDFKACASEALEHAFRQLARPAEEVRLPGADPLQLPSLTIAAGTGAVGAQQNFKNVEIYGFTDPVPGSAGLDIDFQQKRATIDVTLREVKLISDYDVNGKVLLLPIYGKGRATVVLENVRIVFTLDFEEYEKNSKTFWKVIDKKLILSPALVKFNFEDLFDSDKALGDNINKVINENWKEVFDDVKVHYEEAFAQIIGNFFNNVFTRVPLSELFE